MDSIRSVRVFGSAVFDWVATYGAAYILVENFPNLIFQTLGFKTKLQWYMAMIPLAVMAHGLTGTRTHMMKELSNDEMNIFKIVFVVSIWLVIIPWLNF